MTFKFLEGILNDAKYFWCYDKFNLFHLAPPEIQVLRRPGRSGLKSRSYASWKASQIAGLFEQIKDFSFQTERSCIISF